MRILGIDPGVATVGFGVIEAQAGRQQMIQYGAITTPAGQPLAARLVQRKSFVVNPYLFLMPTYMMIQWIL